MLSVYNVEVHDVAVHDVAVQDIAVHDVAVSDHLLLYTGSWVFPLGVSQSEDIGDNNLIERRGSIQI